MATASNRIISLKKYAEDLRFRIKNKIIPPRRVDQVEPYLAFLERDLRKTEQVIDRLILSGTK